MSKLLIISGPTATGKTALAVKLAQRFNGELISADSRQIYQGLDIGVGKDHPPGTPIHLIDLVAPNRLFSVAEYQKFALQSIADVQSRGRLPIVVGCSGLYIDSIINPRYTTFSTKPNWPLRQILEKLPLNLLQLTLRLLDFKTFRLMNTSDLANPRRLIRKIELSLSRSCKLKIEKSLSAEAEKIENYLHLSLTAPSSFLYPRIDSRVDQRLKLGHLDELKSLLATYSWSSPGLKVSAYQVFQPYFNQKQSLEECTQKWKFLEHRDARRQKTWFKKQSNLHFFDVSRPSLESKITKLVNNWLNDVKINHGTTKS